MNEEKKKFLLKFIELYELAKDKEAFIMQWKSALLTEDCILTKSDALNSVYGAWLETMV